MDYINKIPRTIHYCWFGGKEKPWLVKKCIESWQQHLPHYEILEWNENNFNININPYMKEAYNAGKYAFVSDYVRVYALYNYGGIYLDTDVEVFKPFDDLLHHNSFWGFEQENYIATSTIGAEKGNALIKEFLDSYKEKKFIKEDGTFNQLTNVVTITRLLEEKGLRQNGHLQEINEFGVFYPQTYFSPYDYINCQTFITDKTYTIHHFYKSWLPIRKRIKGKVKFILSKLIGGHNIARLRRIYR
ncbi:glycosyltransferase family 32 protein [Neobacillus terrae]|uniref:glycosyltransferase family 32 protein n=1 Tax=Neobacillus terrae TaxID=3034837 RepID=UPI00140DC563|nr:glycosyltransferase [Neobacillus terrae]NHM29262.1 glycosyl transferase [Neobacillus terrae]